MAATMDICGDFITLVGFGRLVLPERFSPHRCFVVSPQRISLVGSLLAFWSLPKIRTGQLISRICVLSISSLPAYIFVTVIIGSPGFDHCRLFNSENAIWMVVSWS